ncbi:BMC domain-containing protein [Natronospora cellulosivora (SeqCode)]
MNKSFALLETQGVAAAFYGLDAMLKNTNVSYVGDEKNLGAGLATVIISGNISAVRNAIEIGKNEAKKINKVLTASYISNPHSEIVSFIYRNNPDYKNKEIKKKKDIKEDKKSIGFVEIYGYAASLIAADAALKSSNVSLLALDKTKGKANTPGLIMFLKLAGNVDAVKTAVEVAVETAKKYNDTVSHTVIAQPDAMIKRMIKEGI